MYYVVTVTDEPYSTHVGNKSVSTEESSRHDLTLVHFKPAAENALSASTEVGGTVNKYL